MQPIETILKRKSVSGALAGRALIESTVRSFDPVMVNDPYMTADQARALVGLIPSQTEMYKFSQYRFLNASLVYLRRAILHTRESFLSGYFQMSAALEHVGRTLDNEETRRKAVLSPMQLRSVMRAHREEGEALLSFLDVFSSAVSFCARRPDLAELHPSVAEAVSAVRSDTSKAKVTPSLGALHPSRYVILKEGVRSPVIALWRSSDSPALAAWRKASSAAIVESLGVSPALSSLSGVTSDYLSACLECLLTPYADLLLAKKVCQHEAEVFGFELEDADPESLTTAELFDSLPNNGGLSRFFSSAEGFSDFRQTFPEVAATVEARIRAELGDVFKEGADITAPLVSVNEVVRRRLFGFHLEDDPTFEDAQTTLPLPVAEQFSAFGFTVPAFGSFAEPTPPPRVCPPSFFKPIEEKGADPVRDVSASEAVELKILPAVLYMQSLEAVLGAVESSYRVDLSPLKGELDFMLRKVAELNQKQATVLLRALFCYRDKQAERLEHFLELYPNISLEGITAREVKASDVQAAVRTFRSRAISVWDLDSVVRRLCNA